MTTIQFKRKSEVALAISLGAILLSISLIRIIQTPSMMMFDQIYYWYRFQDPYPIIEQGFPPFWISGLIQLFGVISEMSLNMWLRMVSAGIFILSAGLLGWSLRGRGGLGNFVLWMLLIFTSGFQFLWLSSEPLAGAFLMLFLWALVNDFRFGIQALFLALFGLTKPDLLFVALLVCGYLSFRKERPMRENLLRMDRFVGWVGLALLPGFIQSGATYFQSDGRLLNSLGQHYASVIAPLQISGNAPDPWKYFGLYVLPTWGSANNVFAMILSNPARYMDFVFLSMSTSLRKLGQGLLLFYIPPAVMLFKSIKNRDQKMTVLLFLTNLAPIFLFAFFHIRYGARFLPLTLFVIFSGLEATENVRLRRGVRFALIGLLAAQVIFLFIPAYSVGYWIVD